MVTSTAPVDHPPPTPAVTREQKVFPPPFTSKTGSLVLKKIDDCLRYVALPNQPKAAEFVNWSYV